MMPAGGGKVIVQAVGRQPPARSSWAGQSDQNKRFSALKAAPEATKVAAYSGPFASHQRGSGPLP